MKKIVVFILAAATLVACKTKNSEVQTGEAVDLGLSVKWASCNVGANSPEGYGKYFAWGETVVKSNYSTSNSLTYGASFSDLKLYGVVYDGSLTAEYDAATVNWGENWRMPTLDEIKELTNKCTWERFEFNGVPGCRITGPNGNSIFLPASGVYRDDYQDGSLLYDVGFDGYYWSSTPHDHSIYSYSLCFNSDGYEWTYGNRYQGRTVRPVFCKK